MIETIDPALQVLEGVSLQGDINTPDETLLANIQHSIRLGYPQIRPQMPQAEQVLLVGGGPSLAETESELVDLHFQGAKIVTVNGSYAWCLARNLRPSAHIVLDARESNSRFVDPPVPQCKYFLASQCAPAMWDRVKGRSDVWIWHAAGPDNAASAVLNEFYLKSWHGIVGGTTVVMRAIELLRTIGFLRMHLFGVDSCFLDGQHHAYAQPENDRDKRIPFTVSPTNHPELARTFICAPWHLKQLEDLLQIVRVNGEHFRLNIHGRGLLAYALAASADVQFTIGSTKE